MAKKDLADLIRRLKAIPQQVRDDIQPAIDKSAKDLAARIEYLAPIDTEAGGTLRESVKVTHSDVPLAARVSAGGALTTKKTKAGAFDYALGVEYGTTDAPMQAFFWPSVRDPRMKARNRRRVNTAINKAIKKVWGA